ncbi:PAS domain-containing protein [Massilia sp.]|uniref:hybrid sensor histidine kinase/response regulator n=1 Tax=Massilia sp. TaxID=1882437 RepID=UPI00289CBBAE|nr:PAS domain-containing protein [Massilia sp.]
MQDSDDMPAQETITLGWSLFEAIPDCVHLLDADGVIVALNRNGMQALEIDDPAQLLGSAWRALWPQESRAAIDAALALACAGGAGKAQAACLTITGCLKWWDVVVTRTASPDGHQAHLLAILRDITEQVAADDERARLARQLQAASERFEKIVSQAAIGVVQLDTDGRITLANERYCAMIDRSEAELVGMSVIDVTAPESVADTLDAVGRLKAGANGVVLNKFYLRRDGSRMPATSSVNALRGPDGEFEGLVAMVLDTTESRQAEETLRSLAYDLAEADRRKTEFLATLAHELRNPLAPIRNGLSVMRLGGDNPAAVGKVREMMERQVGHMVHLIDDLLDVARISGGKLELKRQRCDLKTILASAVETSLPLIEAGHHTLAVDVPDTTLTVDADATRISQVVANLLNNAAKYTPPRGRIRLAVCRDGQEAVIAVSDSGVGIAKDALDGVFDMFSQIGRTVDRSQGGLGIGLSLVRRLVEMHGGTVSAASAGANAGSVFTVRLPLADAGLGAATPQGRAGAQSQDAGAGLKVLVVDDNVDAAVTLSMILDASGYVTRVAHDGHAALAAAREFLPRIAFLDIGMPGMSGYDTARAIRATPELAGMTLVALTGWGAESDRQRSKEAGFDHHLTKPVQLTVVEELLAGL